VDWSSIQPRIPEVLRTPSGMIKLALVHVTDSSMQGV
jgi:hypothetical protein